MHLMQFSEWRGTDRAICVKIGPANLRYGHCTEDQRGRLDYVSTDYNCSLVFDRAGGCARRFQSASTAETRDAFSHSCAPMINDDLACRIISPHFGASSLIHPILCQSVNRRINYIYRL